MKQYDAKKILNIALAGHSGSGKTSVAESILYLSKMSERLGKVADGNTVLDFDSEEKPKDQVFEDNGIKIVTDMKSLLYLLGTTLDFSEGLSGKGFFFNNPNASRTCACGESFAV